MIFFKWRLFTAKYGAKSRTVLSRWSKGIVIPVFVAVLITVIAGNVIKRIPQLTSKLDEKFRLYPDYDEMRQLVLKNLDCSKTLPPNYKIMCEKKVYLNLINAEGDVFLSHENSLGTQIGEWFVRAYCLNSSRKVTIEAKHMAPKKPKMLLESQMPEGYEWHDLFPGLILCRQFYPNPGDGIAPEEYHDAMHLIYYPTLKFKAKGGNTKVVVDRLHKATKCTHVVQLGDRYITQHAEFILRRDELASLRVIISGCVKEPLEKTTLDPEVILIPESLNYYRMMVSDPPTKKDLYNYQATMWSISASPISR